MLAEHCTRKNHHEVDQLQYIAVVMFLGRKPTRVYLELLQKGALAGSNTSHLAG